MPPTTTGTSEDYCATCLGSGFVVDPGGHERSCDCRRRTRLRAFIDRHDDLRGLDKLDGLVERADGRVHPVQGSLIVKAPWLAFRRHLVGWLVAAYLRDPRVRIWITTDARIRSMWLGRRPGSESAQAASVLDDLRAYDLVVVRLQAIKHKATAPALHEALLDARRIWLVESPEEPFGAGHPSWSEELERALRDACVCRIDLSDPVADLDLDAIMRTP